MFNKSCFFILFLLFPLVFKGQSLTLSVFVRAKLSEEPLPYATCIDKLSGKGFVCNEQGFFSFTTLNNNINLQISYVGYNKYDISINLKKDSLIFIYLDPFELDEVEIKINKTPFYTLSMSGKVTIPLENINLIPPFMGEKDVIKALTFLPGVSFGREGYSTLLVRGGNRDQNLILLDGCPIFNVNHLGGFISLFNTNAIQHVDLYKNSFPARFGGKTSSVLDIRMKEGNREKIKGEITTGILSTGALIEGPIINKKTTIIASFRTSYLYLLQHFARQDYKNNNQGSYTDYNFYDVNAKISHSITESSKLFLNFYTGGDYFSSNEKTIRSSQSSFEINGYNINNLASTIGYQFVANKKYYYTISLFSSSYRLASKYESVLQQTQNTDSIISTLKTSIGETGVQFSLNFQPKEHVHNIRIGAKMSTSPMLPGVFTYSEKLYPGASSFSYTYGLNKVVYPMTLAFFVEDEWNITEYATLNSGLRGSIWRTESFTTQMLEPRFSIRLGNQSNGAFNLGYSLSQQPIHGVVSMNYGLEREIWLPSSKNLLPQTAHQLSGGIYLKSESYNTDYSLETFYKKMNNLLDFGSIGSEQNISNSLEDVVYKNGIGEVYGLEFLVEKRSDFFYSSLSYTISKSTRQFPELNSGKSFASDFDRLHDLCLLVNYTPSKNVSYGLLFVLQSGTPTTLPSGYFPGNNGFPGYFIYSGLNTHRLPPYHRVDFSMKRTWDNKRGRKKIINLNVYNVYARINPVYIFIDNEVIVKKSYFRIIPSVSYTYEF